MIKKTEYIDMLNPFSSTVFGCRIQSTAAAYGMNEPFAQFWTQDDKAAFCKLDEVLIMDANGADFDEIKDFITMTGASRMLCDLSAARNFDLPIDVRGEIMVYHQNKPMQAPGIFEINPSLREIHALLSECTSHTFVPPEFEPFYMDMSHRIRHNTAASVGVRQGETLVSCAICSAYTSDKAVLSAVAVSPDFRRKGFGYAALRGLISQLPQENIYIFRTHQENEEFYRKFGFTPCGEFAELNL